jgi:hypothetical protein
VRVSKRGRQTALPPGLVTKLLIKEARKREIDAQVIEWPGDKPKNVNVDLDIADFRKLRGKKKAFL